ncbi:MAG: DNA-binding protein [Proteobacteria bacterium]|nr:DNA-binding protein [Pseudomonadota bacterium]
MARGGVYRNEVEKARNALLAEGKHPSVDAVRVALGNTGSKTTIHRHLKELEAEDAGGLGGQYPISDTLADLVSRLAGRLNEEADTKIAEAKSRFDAQLQDRGEQLEKARQENTAVQAQLERTETACHEEKIAHKTTQQSLQEATTQIRGLEERIAGLNTRLAEHEAHAQSLEEKHRHAREALEHYRTSVKEQRDQDQRRHEHQIQELQVALRQANETIAEKNHELLQLNRDNGRLTEHGARLDKELHQVRGEVRAAHDEVASLKTAVAELATLRATWTQDLQTLERLRAELATTTRSLDQERTARQSAEGDALKAQARLQALEDVLAKLQPPAGATAAPATG